MSDLISRQAAIEVASRECHELRGIFSNIEHGLKELPSAEPERKKGKWIHNDSWVNTCSECGMGWNRAFLSDQWNFCPNCGSCNGGE